MKTSLTILSVLFLVSGSVIAQDYNRGLKQELEEVDDMYPTQKTTKVEVTKVKTKEVQSAEAPANIQQPGPVTVAPAAAPVVAGPPAPAAASAPVSVQQQPVYIIQQPTTNVEASTIKETRADQLRKQREEVERQNEMKLIERLEDDRLNSEKERSERILAPAMKQEQPAVIQQQQVVSGPATVVAPQQEVVPAGDTAGAINQNVTVVEAQKKEAAEKNKMIVGLIGGAGSYPSVSNVGGSYSLGGSFEMRFPSRVGITGLASYSSFDINNITTCPYCYPGTALVTTMNQWDIMAGFNYTLFKSTLSPLAGVFFDYARRDYSARVTWGYGNPSFTGSNAFNGGILAGFEVKASDNLIIGGELRYFMNISYRTDNPLAYGYGGIVYNIGTPIESLNYYTAVLSTKLMF